MRIEFIRFYFILLFTFFGMNTFAQSFTYSKFVIEKDPVRRIELAIESWNFYIRNNLDSLRILGQDIINNDSLSLYAVGVRNLGSYHTRTIDIIKGIELLNEAREIFSSLKLDVLLSETENELGNAFFLQGNYNQACRYYFASIVTGSRTTDVTAKYNGMIGFGKTVCATGDTTKGLLFIHEYLERCLRDEKYESASDACGYLGMIAGLRGKIELMSAYYVRGIIYAGRSDSKTHRANAYTNKAIDFFYHDKVDSAIFYFSEALTIRREVGATRPIVESLYNLALLNIETGKLKEAKEFAEKGELLSDNGGIKSWQLDCLILLLEIAEKQNNTEEITQLKLNIEIIKGDLKDIGSVDSQIIDTAIEFSALNQEPEKVSYLWEIIAMSGLVLSCGIMLYQERANSV